MLTEDGQHLYVSYDEYHGLIEKLAIKVHQSGWEFDTILCLADRKSTRLNSSHLVISYAVFCLKKKKIATDAHWPTSGESVLITVATCHASTTSSNTSRSTD